MKGKLFTLALVLTLSTLIVSGCGVPTPEPDTGMANPASVYCEEQGYILESRTDEDGTYGVCIFPDGSECEEWAYFRGECGPGAGDVEPTEVPITPTDATVQVPDPAFARDVALDYVFDRYGEVVFPPPGADWTEENVTAEGLVGASTFRYTAADMVVTVAFPVVNPADTIYQVVVSKEGTDFRWEGEVDAFGQVTELAAPSGRGTPVVAWFGYVSSTPDGAQFDDFVTILPEGEVGEFGIEGADEAIEAEIVALRDQEASGKYANFWGTLRCDVIDYGGCQLLVSRIRSGIEITDPEPVEGWEGTIIGLTYDEPGAPQPDDAFILEGEYPVQYGIDSYIAENGWPIYREELESRRDTGQAIRVWGDLVCGFPDVNGCQIRVTRIEIDGAEVDAYEGWATYTDEEYGFSFRYPDTWGIVEGGEIQGEPVPDAGTFIELGQGDLVFIVGVKHSSEDTNIFINRTESLEQMGQVYFLGQEVPRMVWKNGDRVLAMRYGEPENVLDGGIIEVDNLAFTLSLWKFGDDWPNTADISPEVQIEVDQIISSFELTE